MPELPEVETIVRALRLGGRDGPPLLGRAVAGAQVLWMRSIASPLAPEFLERVVGQAVTGMYRRGKFVCLKLSPDTLLIHLRMSGDLRVEPAVDDSGVAHPLLRHDRVVFDFTGGLRMVFNDARKFGRMWLASDPQQVTGTLGPEPLDLAFGWEDLYRLLQASGRRLKPLLLDQNFLAGLGNIYTDEALFAAGLHPSMAAKTLSEEQAERLWTAIRAVLQEGIERNGASIDWVYRGGNFQNHFRVYQRTGKPCIVCGSSIQRLVIGQRSTHFCPVCQPQG